MFQAAQKPTIADKNPTATGQAIIMEQRETFLVRISGGEFLGVAAWVPLAAAAGSLYDYPAISFRTGEPLLARGKIAAYSTGR